MMPLKSLVGMLVYMFEISNDANFNSGTKGICDKSFISFTEFWMLYTLGNGRYDFKMPVSILVNLYKGVIL